MTSAAAWSSCVVAPAEVFALAMALSLAEVFALAMALSLAEVFALGSCCAVGLCGVIAFGGVILLALAPTGLVLAVALNKLTGDEVGDAGATTRPETPPDPPPDPPVSVGPDAVGLGGATEDVPALGLPPLAAGAPGAPPSGWGFTEEEGPFGAVDGTGAVVLLRGACLVSTEKPATANRTAAAAPLMAARDRSNRRRRLRKTVDLPTPPKP